METTSADRPISSAAKPALGGMRGRQQSSLWLDAWRRLRRNRLAIAGIVLLTLLAFVAIFAPLLAPYHYAQQNLGEITQPPSRHHLMGTDGLGRDVFSRLIYGARVSLQVGLIVEAMILLIGVPIGLLAGYRGGWVDTGL